MMFLHDIKIVLSRTAEGGNVGAVCRAMKNMGLSQLRLAAPSPLLLEKIHTFAVNSWDIWEDTRIYNDLPAAIADCSVVIGTTRRRGQDRKSVSMTPRDLASWLANRSTGARENEGNTAIVFGNERTGLEDAELELCNFASHIPVYETPPKQQAQPSLNLSHAVQIYAYELFLALERQHPVKGEWTAMNQEEIYALVDSLAYPKREEPTRFLIDVIARAGLSLSEGRRFKELLIKAQQLNR
jgi:tRNA/rRNA methyltransferase/tRNA (cytidine32/uridine32-2'-O)-methyltransferase